jgi:hypothetical protein
MIDKRFSAQAFEAAGWGSQQSKLLCSQLEAEIQAELHKAIEPAMLGVIQKLNNMDHALSKVGEFAPGELQFREPLAPPKADAYKMILALDVVLTVGYPKPS